MSPYTNPINAFGGGFTPAVKQLILINVGIFLIQSFSGLNPLLIEYFALNHLDIIEHWMLWEVVTYMFLHGGVWHILLNMLFLFFFGAELEREWGTKRFLQYYLFAGIGAGFFIFFVDWTSAFFGNHASPTTLGASGAILGVLVAYALYYPERKITLLIFFIIPLTLKAKYFAIGYAVIELYSFLAKSQSGVSHAGHIGGMLSGLLFFIMQRRNLLYAVPNHTIGRLLGIIKQFFKGGSSSIKKSSFGSGRTSMHVLRSLDETQMTDKEIEKTIDELLEVISSRGLKSLSVEEQLFLDRISQLYRHKFPD